MDKNYHIWVWDQYGKFFNFLIYICFAFDKFLSSFIALYLAFKKSKWFYQLYHISSLFSMVALMLYSYFYVSAPKIIKELKSHSNEEKLSCLIKYKLIWVLLINSWMNWFD